MRASSLSLSYDNAAERIPPHFNETQGTYTVELPKVRHLVLVVVD